MKSDASENDDVFPWREAQKFRLLIDGQEFFPAMLKAINAAKSHVLMEMYIVESGRVTDQFMNALVHAAQRGVVVQILLDDYGSRGLAAKDRQRLRDGGVHLAFYNPLKFQIFGQDFKKNLLRTHRKFLVVDGEMAYVGGTGLADDFVGEIAWRDCMLEIRGSVAADWQTLFWRNMVRWSNHVSMPPANVVPAAGDASGRLVFTSGGVRLQLKKILLNKIRSGQQRIWLASAYFIPSRKIRRALYRAAIRGRDVRLLLPGPVTDHPAVRYAGRRYYTRLLRHGVRIFEFQNHFMHSKVVLIDNWCTIGSSNMDRWNFRWNLEANQEVESKVLAGDVKKMFLDDFAHSEEIHYKLWLQRSWWQRFKERLWGRIDLWVTGWRL